MRCTFEFLVFARRTCRHRHCQHLKHCEPPIPMPISAKGQQQKQKQQRNLIGTNKGAAYNCAGAGAGVECKQLLSQCGNNHSEQHAMTDANNGSRLSAAAQAECENCDMLDERQEGAQLVEVTTTERCRGMDAGTHLAQQEQQHLAAMDYLQQMLQQHQQHQQQQLLLLQKQHELLVQQQQQQKQQKEVAEEQQPSTLPSVDGNLSPTVAAVFYQQLAQFAAVAAGVAAASADSLTSDATATNNWKSAVSPPVQITSIDGFFNRKRGRPPKNRFVEVYKNTQHSPQAIFTSFKLEKQAQGVGAMLLELPVAPAEDVPVATRLDHAVEPPNMSELHTRLLAHQQQLVGMSSGALDPLPLQQPQGKRMSPEVKMSVLPNADKLRPTGPDEVRGSPKRDRISVVRAAGTFYPENSTTGCSNEKVTAAVEGKVIQSHSNHKRFAITTSDRYAPKAKRMRAESKTLPYNLAAPSSSEDDMPQDLSMNATVMVGQSDRENERTLQADKEQQQQLGIRFQNLFTLYQQKQQQYQPQPSTYAAATLMPAVRQTPTTIYPETPTAQDTFLASITAGTVTEAYSLAPAPIASTDISLGLLSKLRDDRIPLGYLKFRFNEDCGFPRCGYRNHQSHFHCNRADCHYSFCDKTRFVQHTARHERVDTLMGDDFSQYRANMTCGRSSCPYQRQNTDSFDNSASSALAKKSSHFHCRKCDFICSDTNKVVAHRRLHSKMEYIRMAGFRKVASNESCYAAVDGHDKMGDSRLGEAFDSTDSCPYSMKHTHYHCLVCDCSVLSRAQLVTHKHKIAASTTKPSSIATSTTTSAV